ncbi:hypothetical protein JNB62_15830 [Microbacterium jejuense]|uniref:Uncharacterized protein n=1 Tax=Microbacterium jejuense TaxID=1263637 RepID=A0ABS7HSD2_9MICO|nr:hypothetical protein [Microbacterium jejuense]MBW9095156.1 hypothetical protein [Microbacterium jejuense]
MTVQLPAGTQHGTPEGYAAGCRREKDCPATRDHGMCCLYAHVRSITDIRYHQARARDARPAAIARRLGITPPESTVIARQADVDEQFAGRPDNYRWKPRHPRTTPTPTPTPKELSLINI